VSDLRTFIDISYWNTADGSGGHVLDTTKLREANIDAVGVRVGRGQADSSTNIFGFDNHVQETVAKLEAAGYRWWPYWRVGNGVGTSPVDQARLTISALEAVPASPAPLIVDIEDNLGGMSGSALEQYLTDYRYALADLGVSDISIYTSASWWDGHESLRLRWSDLDLVVAHWLRDDTGVAVPMSENARKWDEDAEEFLPEGPNMPRAWASWGGWQLAGTGSAVGQAVGLASEDVTCGLLLPRVSERWFG
jgi:hypothetical protein